MKSIIGMFGCLLMLLNLAGCISSTETDPRKGGLFGYNPEAYEKRIQERKDTLAATKADTEKTAQEGRRLKDDRQQKEAEHEVLKSRLAALYAESGRLQRQLDQARAVNTGQKKELQRLQQAVTDLRSKTLSVNSSGASDAAKKAEIARLQKRMDVLLEEAEALSSL